MRNLLFLSALYVSVSVAAHADSVFSLGNNSYSDGLGNTGSATGTVSINTAGNMFDSATIVFTLNGVPLKFTGTQSAGTVDGSQDFYTTTDTAGDLLTIDLPVTSLVGYAGGSLCTNATPCADALGNPTTGAFYSADFSMQLNADTGSLAMTPEPSSIVLAGTGLIAAAGAMRRRMLASGV